MRLPGCLVGALSLAGLIQFAAATLSKETKEYCEGTGSICEVREKLEQDCKEYTGSDYWKCVCTSGYAEAYIA